MNLLKLIFPLIYIIAATLYFFFGTDMNTASYFGSALGVFIVLIALLDVFFIVRQKNAVLVERFGKFVSQRSAGLNFKYPFIDTVVHQQTLRIHEMEVEIETKTKDDVFVKIKVAIQTLVSTENVQNAYYELDNPHGQITSFVYDVVRAEVPKQKLDEVFEHKDSLATSIKNEIGEAMVKYGHEIVQTLITDIDPDESVKIAMNRINAAEREKAAATHEAEARFINSVRDAEAEAESKKLQGLGIANQRREIAKGLEESVKMLKGTGIDEKEASAMIIITQHYDTLQNIGAKNNSNLILMDSSAGAVNNVMKQTLAALQANDATKTDKEA